MTRARSIAPPPRIPDRTIWIDGTLKRGDQARVLVFDRGARDGEGLFETVRVHRGRPLHWEAHLERIVVSAAELGFPVPPAPQTLANALDEVLAAEGLADAVARLTITRGIPGGRPTRAGCWIEAMPLAGRLWKGTRAGRGTAVVSRVPFEPGVLGRHKTTSRLAYHLAREEARAAAADEALLVSPSGMVLEGSASTVFVASGGRLVTPPLEHGILPGIVRGWVLAACGRLGITVREEPVPHDRLALADEVFLTNSVQTIVPIGTLDGRGLPERTFGERLRQTYAATELE